MALLLLACPAMNEDGPTRLICASCHLLYRGRISVVPQFSHVVCNTLSSSSSKRTSSSRTAWFAALCTSTRSAGSSTSLTVPAQ